MTRIRDCRGFTLLEMMVAVLVVGLTVTVFFQLFSASLKLERRGRSFDEIIIRGQEIFALLQARDLRRDDFPWSGEEGDFSWQLTLEPVEIKPDVDQETEETPTLRLPSELYRLVFVIRNRNHPARQLRLVAYRRVAVGYYNDEFKKEHLAGS